MFLLDGVPGISRGIIAFIFGFYYDFVDSLNNIVPGNKIAKIRAFKFLSKIGV